jgi:hypothetical protein
MNGQPPPIDRRGRDEIAARTMELAGQYAGWRPRTDGKPDAGRALIGIFARFAELAVQRINRAPDRNYLAFLNLIGIRPLPPLPARVPLTFSLAEGSPVDAVVPAGTQVAAAPLDGEDEEVVFETDNTLVVTRAQLQAVLVGDAETDTFADRGTAATRPGGAAFEAFAGEKPVPHQLFIACEPVLTGPGTKNVTFALTPAQAALLDWPLSWAYWDGAEWQPATHTEEVREGVRRVTLARLPQLPPREVNGIQAAWVRAQLNMALPPGKSGLPPESVASGGRLPQDDVAGYFPFGETTQVKFCYLSADEAIAAGGATVRFDVTLARPGVPRNVVYPVRLIWTYKVGSEWKELGQSSSVAARIDPDRGETQLRDETLALTKKEGGIVSFPVPLHWPRELFRGRYGRWLRVEIADGGGSYATLPQLASITTSYVWDIPSLTKIEVQADTPPAPVAPPAAFCNSSPLDVSGPVYPFGEEPRFTDTFALACPESLARPEATLELTVRLANAAAGGPVPVVRTDGDPTITWDAWDGTGWQAVTVNPPDYDFTTDATVRITLPPGFARTQVNGADQFWVRARLAGGNYGVAASYREKPDGLYYKDRDGKYVPNPGGAYEIVDATFAPPVIAALSWTLSRGAGTPLPPTACVSYNDFGYLTRSLPFPPFTPGEDRDAALYLGFDKPFDTRPVTIYFQVEPPDPEEVAADRLAGLDPAGRARLVWEYSGPNGWRPLAAVDGTEGLANRGVLQFVGPADLIARTCFGQDGCWLRLRWQRGEFSVTPRLRRILPNTTWATQAATVAEEILGSGTLDAGQSFVAAHTPMLDGERLVVREPDAGGEVWLRWQAVPDFYRSGPQDRHYTVDPQTGEIRFGDGTAGRLPPRGQNNIRISYRTGGGAAGNRDAGSVVTLKSTVPYVDSVTNHERSQGGSPAEPLDRLRARGPRVLRHRDRAVTAEDLEDIAFAAAADVARVRTVLPSKFDPFNLWLDPRNPRPAAGHTDTDAGRVGVIVVPDSAEPRPAPSLGLLRQVQGYLRDRCPATAELWVAGPEWVRVTVTATVVPVSPDVADAVRGRVDAALTRYLHPLTGGSGGDGWAFGRKPHDSDLFAVAEGVDGVDHVRSLEVALRAESDDLGARLEAVLNRPMAEATRAAPALELRGWLRRALVYSGPHQITVTLRG